MQKMKHTNVNCIYKEKVYNVHTYMHIRIFKVVLTHPKIYRHHHLSQSSRHGCSKQKSYLKPQISFVFLLNIHQKFP